jgi:hypothetical protein
VFTKAHHWTLYVFLINIVNPMNIKLLREVIVPSVQRQNLQADQHSHSLPNSRLISILNLLMLLYKSLIFLFLLFVSSLLILCSCLKFKLVSHLTFFSTMQFHLHLFSLDSANIILYPSYFETVILSTLSNHDLCCFNL